MWFVVSLSTSWKIVLYRSHRSTRLRAKLQFSLRSFAILSLVGTVFNISYRKTMSAWVAYCLDKHSRLNLLLIVIFPLTASIFCGFWRFIYRKRQKRDLYNTTLFFVCVSIWPSISTLFLRSGKNTDLKLISNAQVWFPLKHWKINLLSQHD